MGVMLGRFSKTEIKDKNANNHVKRSSIIECSENDELILDNAVPFHINTDDKSVFTPSNKKKNLKAICKSKLNKVLKKNSSNQNGSVKSFSYWDFEDEYKSYLQKSIKRKLRSSDVSQPMKLRKVDQGQSALLHHPIIHEIPIDILQTTPTNLERRFSGNFNTVLKSGKVIIEKIPTSAVTSCILINKNEIINIENIKSRRRINTRFNSMKNGNNNTKFNNFELMEPQLRISELRVVLDQTIVVKYLNAKRIIDEILRSHESKKMYSKSF